MKQKYNVTVEELGITFSTGTMAKQANGAVCVSLGDTTIFVAATAATTLRPGQDFFPLTVDYREKFSAAGRFPGGFFKREGRPSEKEILTSRLCDRPLRPLFPKGFMNEVQILGNLLTTDLTNEPDVLMVNGASAALMTSDIPWSGPIGCVRVAEIDGEFVVNPTNEQQFESRLDLIYVGNEEDMMMIEGSADQLSEERFCEALEFAHSKVQLIINAQKELASMLSKPKQEFKLYLVEEQYVEKSIGIVGDRLKQAVFQDNKLARQSAVDALQEEVCEKLLAEMGEDTFDRDQVRMAFEELQEKLYRDNILDNGKRVDGRGVEDIRPIEMQIGILPRVHGSALFQRGETQSLVITTLGTSKDTQELDGLTGGPKSKSFILHYNFPPFSVGETGRTGTPGRREIGHGALAERSILPVAPPEDEFPYTMRVVSDIMESNGSSSMASVCGGCLSLMDAGVPLIAPVAGISTGLVTRMDENGKIKEHVVLTDILGAEDHFGDMDFKISGSREGITGFQLDLKIQGLPLEIAREAIMRLRDARCNILDQMATCIAEPRGELNANAPRIHQVQIDPEKIGMLIGPGGKNIKRICDITGAKVDIHDDDSGWVSIYATTKEAMERALQEIEMVAADIEVGKIYKGIVRSVKDFGCFVECLPGKEGMVHISELAETRVETVEDVCNLGDVIDVKCIGIDDRGRVRLSRRAAICEAKGIEYTPSERPSGGDRGDRGDRGGRGGDRGGRGGDRGGRGGDRGGRGGDRGGRGRSRD